MGHLPETDVCKNRQLGRGDRHQHDDGRGDYGQPRQQSEHDEHAAGDFENGNEIGQELWRGQADLDESAYASDLGRKEFLYPFR